MLRRVIWHLLLAMGPNWKYFLSIRHLYAADFSLLSHFKHNFSLSAPCSTLQGITVYICDELIYVSTIYVVYSTMLNDVIPVCFHPNKVCINKIKLFWKLSHLEKLAANFCFLWIKSRYCLQLCLQPSERSVHAESLEMRQILSSCSLVVSSTPFGILFCLYGF